MKTTILFIGVFLINIFSVLCQIDTITIDINVNKYIEKVKEKLDNNNIDFISIPVFNIDTNKVSNYECGDNLFEYISFIENPEFQKIVLENGKVPLFRIDKDYNNEYIHEWFLSGVKKERRKIYKYKKEHPNEFVFMINGIHGFWVIKNNSFYKASSSIISGKMKLYDARRVYYQYGEQLIKDTSMNIFRFGYFYQKCEKVKANTINDIYVIFNKTRIK